MEIILTWSRVLKKKITFPKETYYEKANQSHTQTKAISFKSTEESVFDKLTYSVRAHI